MFRIPSEPLTSTSGRELSPSFTAWCPLLALGPLPIPFLALTSVSFHPLQLARLILLTSSSHLIASQLRKASLALCLNRVQTLHSGLSDPRTVIALAPVTHTAFAMCHTLWLPRWLSGKATCQFGGRGFNPWVGKIPWRRKWQPTPWENPRDRGTWWAVGHGVTKNQAPLSGHHSCIVLSTLHRVISFMEKAMAPYSSTLAWEIHGWRSLVGCSPWGF